MPELKLNFEVYIKRVVSQVHPTLLLEKRASECLNAIINYSLLRLTQTCNTIKPEDKKTLSPLEIQTAVKLVIPGELSKHGVVEGFMSVNKASSAYSKKGSLTEKANLLVSVPRVSSGMRKLSIYERQGKYAGVYAAAVLEYLLAEISELAGNITRKKGKKTITVADVKMAINNDEELRHFYKDVIIKGPFRT